MYRNISILVFKKMEWTEKNGDNTSEMMKKIKVTFKKKRVIFHLCYIDLFLAKELKVLLSVKFGESRIVRKTSPWRQWEQLWSD